MQKISFIALLLAASLVLSGCSLLGSTSETEPELVAPGATEVMPGDTSDTQKDMMESEELDLQVAVPDPAAEQAAMQETQEDAPTGVVGQ